MEAATTKCVCWDWKCPARAAAPACSCSWLLEESSQRCLWQLSEGVVPILVWILEELVTKSYGFICCFLEIILPFLMMEAEVRGERRYYCISDHHAQPERWSVISLLVKMAPCVQDPPNRNTSALLLSVIISSGVHTVEALPWAKAHSCPRRWLSVGSHQPGCALAWAVLATGSPCHPGRTAGRCRTAGCPHPSINVAVIQHKVLAIVFSRHKSCPDNNLNTNLASCSWCDAFVQGVSWGHGFPAQDSSHCNFGSLILKMNF